MAWRRGLVFSTAIQTLSLPGSFSPWEGWSQGPGEKLWVNVLPFQAHSHYFLYLPPTRLLTDHMPRPLGLSVLSLEKVDPEPRQAI